MIEHPSGRRLGEPTSARPRSPRTLGFIGVLLAAVLGGCGPSPYTGTVTITASEDFRQPSGLLPTVQIDVIGATALELQRWKAYPVTEYWSTADGLRKSAARHSFVMTTDEPGPFELTRWSGQFDGWKKKGVTSLVLIADLPGAWQPRPPKAEEGPPPGVIWFDANDDPRKLVIPWVQQAYGLFTSNVDVSMSPQRLTLETAVDMSEAVPAAGK